MFSTPWISTEVLDLIDGFRTAYCQLTPWPFSTSKEIKSRTVGTMQKKARYICDATVICEVECYNLNKNKNQKSIRNRSYWLSHRQRNTGMNNNYHVVIEMRRRVCNHLYSTSGPLVSQDEWKGLFTPL